jgi:starch phosphorylase
VVRHRESVETGVHCAYYFEEGTARLAGHHPATLRGVPYDRPVVGYGARTINTLRLWEATSPDYFDLNEFNHGDFFGAVHDKLLAENITRVLYPDDSTSAGHRTSSSRARLRISSGAFVGSTATGERCPRRSPSS